MPFITREDGEHFVVPSYRDVITAKNNSQLKKEIETLSDSYGEYITLQKKNQTQYEVAFSPDPGYLLGESVWHHFSRPQDMIYCEAIPNSAEAILVIVKSGSVYLDGTFPIDSIVEELVVFLTQENDFEIYTYGNVPISQEPQEGKFAFEASSVKSFNVLDEPVFPALALLKIYQLQLVKTVLEIHGIGVFPVKKAVIALLLVGVLYMGYEMITPEEVAQVKVQVSQIRRENPYKVYDDTLRSPAPDEEVKNFLKIYWLYSAIPGWKANGFTFSGNMITARVTTKGALVKSLLSWGEHQDVKINIDNKGISIEKKVELPNRTSRPAISDIKLTIATIIDRIHAIQEGNVVKVGAFAKTGKTQSANITVSLDNVSPLVISFVADQLYGLPVKVQKITMDIEDDSASSTMILQVVGS